MARPVKYRHRSRLWREKHGLSLDQAAAILGLKKETIKLTHDYYDRMTRQVERLMRCYDLMTPEQRRQLLDEVING